MRKILFKAKTANPNGLENHNSYWVYGLLEKLDNGMWLIKGEDGNYFVYPKTVCQLFNCGSGDFYEDDKVFYDGKEYVVKFHLSFATLERNMVQHGENESIFINEDVAYIMKLTGNIHD